MGFATYPYFQEAIGEGEALALLGPLIDFLTLSSTYFIVWGNGFYEFEEYLAFWILAYSNSDSFHVSSIICSSSSGTMTNFESPHIDYSNGDMLS